MAISPVAQTRICGGVIFVGMALSVIFTCNCIFVQHLLVDGLVSVPPSFGLMAAAALFRKPLVAFKLATISAGLGLIMMAYLKTHLEGAETGFLAYGATLAAASRGVVLAKLASLD